MRHTVPRVLLLAALACAGDGAPDATPEAASELAAVEAHGQP